METVKETVMRHKSITYKRVIVLHHSTKTIEEVRAELKAMELDGSIEPNWEQEIRTREA